MIYFTDREIAALFAALDALEEKSESDSTFLNAMRKKLSQEMTKRYAERAMIKSHKKKAG